MIFFPNLFLSLLFFRPLFCFITIFLGKINMLFLQLELINAIISLLNYMRMVMLGLYAENREYVLVLAIFERIYSGEP